MIIPDLIFDLGMHKGEDAAFYLAKGFRVVALEANPAFTEAVVEQQSQFVAERRLEVVERALWHHEAEGIPFFVNPVKDDWSSLSREWAGKGGHETREIRVKGITVSSLFDRYGVPYYAKCDLEGADSIFTSQLARDGRRPAFASIEAVSLECLADLYAAGYRCFQIVNQSLLWGATLPQPPREGNHVAVHFTGTMSGPFGRELPADKWRSFSDITEHYLGFKRLHQMDPELAFGWLDFHATTEEWLARI